MAWNNEIEHRVSITSDMLQQIKTIKMVGLAPSVSDLVQDLRHSEMEQSKPFRILFTIMQASGMGFPT